ncbi:MAG: hypothetical protein E6340_10295, partial [Actinomyces sp.]|nr:hypothetical protein [Actinomyces sp.]
TGGVLNPLKNATNTSHNELLHQDPLQPPLEPRANSGVGLYVVRRAISHVILPWLFQDLNWHRWNFNILGLC